VLIDLKTPKEIVNKVGDLAIFELTQKRKNEKCSF